LFILNKFGSEFQQSGAGDRYMNAIVVSCHSFIPMTRPAALPAGDDGARFAMSYVDANRVTGNRHAMGPLNASPAFASPGLFRELGQESACADAISPSPLRSASPAKPPPLIATPIF